MRCLCIWINWHFPFIFESLPWMWSKNWEREDNLARQRQMSENFSRNCPFHSVMFQVAEFWNFWLNGAGKMVPPMVGLCSLVLWITEVSPSSPRKLFRIFPKVQFCHDPFSCNLWNQCSPIPPKTQWLPCSLKVISRCPLFAKSECSWCCFPQHLGDLQTFLFLKT